jgi:hypothetical protein
LLLALGALLVASLVGTAAAGLPNYGDFVGTNVTFKSVEETTQTTDPPVLFGAPTVAGNQLTFTPTGFIATATGGASDLTSSILTTTIVGNSPTDTIDVIIIEELGNVTLTGPGGAPTNASASIGGFATVLATTAGPTFSVIPFSGIFSPADTFSLPGDAGTQLWSGTAVIDIAAVVPNATNVVLQYDDTLDANSEASSMATIEKTDVTITVVPEPSVALLFGSAGLALIAFARRQHR